MSSATPSGAPGATIAGQLADFVTGRRFADLPPVATDYAAMLVSSTIASAAFGFTLESAKIMRRLEQQRGGVAEASLWFGGAPKLPLAAAARINALMSDAAASDDSDLRNITHPGTTLAACVLATAEVTGASGEDILRAIVLGYEVAGRINGAVVPGLRERGYHGCVIAVFGGTVATGLLLGLDAQKMTHAIALAATSIGGIMAAAKTSVAREYHAGLAAMLGVNAAQAANLGYTAEPSILECPEGYFDVIGAPPDAARNARVAAVTRGFGERWEILTNMGIKLVPGGHPYHSMAEAAAAAARAGDVKPADIERILISSPYMKHLHGPRHPTDLIGIAHSPAYFLASGAADRSFGWAHASEAKINDPAIRGLLDKVEVVAQPTQELERFKQGCIVTIHTRDGREHSATIYAPRGAAVLGIRWEDVEEKYRALTPAAGLAPQAIEASCAVIRKLRQLKHASELTQLLR